MEHDYMTADTKVWDYMCYPACLNNVWISNNSFLELEQVGQLERWHPGVGRNIRLCVWY